MYTITARSIFSPQDGRARTLVKKLKIVFDENPESQYNACCRSRWYSSIMAVIILCPSSPRERSRRYECMSFRVRMSCRVHLCRRHNRMTYICDSDEIRGIFDERDHDGIVEDFVGDIQPKPKERECGFRSAGISPEDYIVVDCSLMTCHSVLRFQYDGLRIGIKVSNKSLHGRRILPDNADSALEKSRCFTVGKTIIFFWRLKTYSCAIAVILPWDDRTMASLHLKASITSFEILLASVLLATSVYSSKAK